MPTIDWSKLSTLEYWLEGIAGQTGGSPFIEIGSFFFWFYLYFFCTIIVLGIGLRVSQAFFNEHHPLQKRFPMVSSNMIWVGVLGLGWFLMRQINFGLLGARLWLLVFLLWGIILGYILLRDFMNFYPIELAFYRKQRKEGVW